MLPEGPTAIGAALGMGLGYEAALKEWRIWLDSQIGVRRAGRGQVDVLLEVLWKSLRNNASRRQFLESISVHKGQKGTQHNQNFCKSISFYFITQRFTNCKRSLSNLTWFPSGITRFNFSYAKTHYSF